MGRLARKKQHKGDKPLKEKYRTKRKTKDYDEIHEDLKPRNAQKLLNQDIDFDRPGQAQHYCIHCAWVVLFVCLSNASKREHKTYCSLSMLIRIRWFFFLLLLYKK